MEIQGKIIELLPELRTQSGKVKYGFLLETASQYPQKIPFDVWGEDKWNQMGVKVGQNASVSFDINGREYNGRHFVSLTAWKVTATGGTQKQQPQPQQTAPQQQPSGDNSLPF